MFSSKRLFLRLGGGGVQRQDKGQRLIGIKAVTGYIGLATCQSKIYKKYPPSKPPLFEQLPRAQIEQKSKKFSAHQIANDKTMMLSIEIVQKVHSRPKLQRFEVKITAKLSIEA